MTRIFTLFICFSSLTLYCQNDSLLKKTYYPKSLKLCMEFYVDQNSIKNGSYKMFYENKRLKFKGQYSNGEKSGVWETFDNTSRNRLLIKYDYDTKEELEYNYPVRKDRLTFIEVDGKYKAVYADQVSHFPGGWYVFYEYLQEKFSKIDTALFQNIDQSVFVHWTIDENGESEVLEFTNRNIRSYPSGLPDVEFKFPNDQLRVELIKVFQEMPKWIPTELDGKKYTTYFVIPIKI